MFGWVLTVEFIAGKNNPNFFSPDLPSHEQAQKKRTVEKAKVYVRKLTLRQNVTDPSPRDTTETSSHIVARRSKNWLELSLANFITCSTKSLNSQYLRDHTTAQTLRTII